MSRRASAKRQARSAPGWWGPAHHYIEASDIADEIVEYAGEGNSAAEIAQELGVSEGSVRRVLEDKA